MTTFPAWRPGMLRLAFVLFVPVPAIPTSRDASAIPIAGRTEVFTDVINSPAIPDVEGLTGPLETICGRRQFLAQCPKMPPSENSPTGLV